MAVKSAKANYQVFGTKLDLICTINYPTVFADNRITKNPANAGYNFVSENCIPIQSGLIKDSKKPGGNVTGVGVFTQMISMIRLALMIKPKVKKMAVASRDAMTQVNEWFEAEFRRACKEEGVEFVEFRRVTSAEDHLAFVMEYDAKGSDYFVADGIGPAVSRDGSRMDPKLVYANSQKSLKSLLYLGYDEEPIKVSGVKVAATSVIWYDIGAQLADKGIRILDGAKPGELSWDYPRKFNIILNLVAARKMGFVVSEKLLGAAYRVYTDLEGY